MNMHERQHDQRERPATSDAPAAAADSGLRDAGERLLARGADAIQRALSQDSAAFLSSNQQTGGQ